MSPQSFIFIGRSGSGKGTQVQLLMEYLKQKTPDIPVLYIQTGQELRNFIKGDSLTQVKAREIYDVGGLEPEFLIVHMWVKVLVENYRGKQHLIFDGTPRKFHEAGVMDSIFGFYGLAKPIVIEIDISAPEALTRLLKRKRSDDTEEDIKNRLAWYESEVVPALDYLRNNNSYKVLKIPGERSIQEIHADIVEKLGLN